MPAAGFYSIHTNKLSFRADGLWYADDEPVLHERLARLFSRYVRRRQAGGYEIWIDERYHADVEIEDTPFVVRAVDPQADGHFTLDLNDGTSEPLDPLSVQVGGKDVLYCSVKSGTERARFLRTAYYQLAQYIVEPAPGRFELRCGDRFYVIHPS